MIGADAVMEVVGRGGQEVDQCSQTYRLDFSMTTPTGWSFLGGVFVALSAATFCKMPAVVRRSRVNVR